MTKGNETSIRPVQRLLNLLKPDRHEIKNVYLYSIFNGIISLSLPLGIQAIVNLIQGGQVSTSLVVLVTIVVLGVGFSGVLQIFQLRITENLQQKIFTRAAFEFVYRIPRIQLSELYREYAPELMNRFFDIVTVQKGLAKILINFSAAALQMLFGLLLLSFYHPFFILFSLFLIGAIYAIIHFTGKQGLKTSLEESKHKYKVAHWLEELARTSTTFKLSGYTQLPLERINRHTGDYLNAREKHFKVLVWQYSLLVAFKVFVAFGLLAIGSILVIEQRMNIGQFVAAEIIILLVMTAAEKIIVNLETIYDVLTAIEKVAQVTDKELENGNGFALHEENRKEGLKLEVSALRFKYPGESENVLQGVNFQLNKGEKAVISGLNASGKSTLLQVVAGLYRPDSGNVIYDDLPQGNIDPSSLRSIIGDCLSHEQLFEGTILENITMGRETATFDNVKWVVAHLGLEHYIKSLPSGYHTPLHPQGKHLPRSIIQKLLLARSIADLPRLLLLEDALEHIAPSEKQQIIEFLTDPETSWTLLAVTNDKFFASKADRMFYMAEGKIEERPADNTNKE